MSDTTTRDVRVEVRPAYLADQSDPQNGLWMFAYHVRISNLGKENVQLLSRHWVITDATGNVKEVRGPGVVGVQPVVVPGGTYEYTSGCPLPTPVGTMHGSYQMRTQGGERFDAIIGPFTLAEPYAVN
jgi:ApaG protein